MPSSDTDATTASPLSLTRREAEQRAATIGVERTEITLDLTRPGPTFDATSVIRFALREGVAPGAETFVDFKGEQLVSVELNGTALDPATWRHGRIPLTGLREQNTVRIAGTMAYSSDGEGLHRHTDPADQKSYLYAMSFLAAAPRWFGCFDQPDLKSTYALDVTATGGLDGPGQRSEHAAGAGAVADQADRAAVHLLRHAGRRTVRVLLPRARRDPARLPCPRVPRGVVGGGDGRPARGDGRVVRLLPPAVRGPLPVRGVPPGVRARLQRRRDGEPRVRDAA